MKLKLLIIALLVINIAQAQRLSLDIEEIEEDTTEQVYVRYKSHFYLNALNGIVGRPRISWEYFLDTRKSVELEAGPLLPIGVVQDVISSYSHLDSYLAYGAYGALAYYKYGLMNPNRFVGFKAYYKYMEYSNENWNNGWPEANSKSFEYVTSSNRFQIGASFMMGSFKTLKKNYVFQIFYGGGLMYQVGYRHYHEKVYDNSLRFNGKTAPFTEVMDNMFPMIHWGFKIGIGNGRKEYNNVKLVNTKG